MNHSGTSSFLYRRSIGALIHSVQGLKACFKGEEAFRLEVLLAVILAPAAVWLSANYVQLLLMIGTIFLVLITELLNTAVESVVDRVGTEFHELSGRAKDVGSAAVLLSMLFFVLVWGVILAENLAV